MCEECAAATPDVLQRQAAAAITQQEEMDARAAELEEQEGAELEEEQKGDEESDEEAEVEGGDDGDEEEDVASDAGTSQDEELEGEEEQEEEEDISSPGSVVWVPWGRFRYPAKVVLLSEVPANLQSCLRKASKSSVLVQFYGSSDFSRVETQKLTLLGHTAADLKLAGRSQQISANYNAALYNLRPR